MKTTDFSMQYKAELESLHAPKDLIARTKEKVKAESTLEKERKKRRRYIYSSTMAAAAAIIVLVGTFTYRRGEEEGAVQPQDMQLAASEQEAVQPQEDVEQTELQMGTTIYLGQNKEEIYLEEQITIDRTAILPMEFLKNTAWEEEISGKPVKFTLDEEENYVAAYEEAEAYVVIYSQTEDLETIKDCVLQMLSRSESAE
ncbi:MAG: hypothetical protein ACI4EQ_01400 [Lachnospiraceae bacterium]